MSETISGITTVRRLLENRELSIGYVDYTNDQTVQKWPLVKDRKYRIPGYQREIRWIPKYVQNLLDDIKKGSKLLGNILVSTSDQIVYEIIDGQQRITAILMILNKLKETGTSECGNLDICQLINDTFPFFYDEMKMGFYIADDLHDKEKFLANDILDQRETLNRLWHCISNYIELLDDDEREELAESLLECELNLIISKVNAAKKQSRKLCVDYFIDINNKSEPLEAIDILKAYAFREHFDEAAKKWMEVQKNEKVLNLEGMYYPKKDLFLHYILCSVNKGLGYKVTKISDNFQLQADVILDDGKCFLKGTDIEVLITDKSFYRNMLNRIIAFQKFMKVILGSKTDADQEFINYFKPVNKKLDSDTISNIFSVLNAVLRSSDIVPKLLIMKYFLDIISNPASTHNDFKIIFPINVLVTCFSAGNANLKVRASYSTIVLKEKWMESVNKSFNIAIKNFPKKVKFGREVQFMGKSTKTSGEYLAKRVAAIASSYKKKDKKYVFNERDFLLFNKSPKINAEHFLINQSGVVSIEYRGKSLTCPYNSRIGNKISYLANYLMIDIDVNNMLGNRTVHEKLDLLNRYIEENPGAIVFGDPLSQAHYRLLKEAFKDTKCPTKMGIDACTTQEEAKSLVMSYYDSVFEEEFAKYLLLIEENDDFQFNIS